MRHVRADYNLRIQDSANLIPEDEPVFLLRGQDRTAAQIVRLWAAAQKHLPQYDPKAVALVEQWANKMDAWPVKKTADV